MDERRHNMDGALFVDERATDSRDARTRTDDRAPRPRADYDDDGKAEAARRVTQGILDRMDLEASVHIRENDEAVVLDIDGPDAGRAIGKKGMTLEALQFLVNKIVNRDPDERRHIVLDSGDYRERHDNGLVSMAKREAKRAVTSGRPVTLEPMSARDRRVIHVSLAKFAGITTRSEGEGMERRLQIIPARGGERARDDRRDDRPREDRPRTGDRSARDDRARPTPARDDRPRPQARSDRPAQVDRDRDRPAAVERDRPAAVERDRDRPAASERDRDRPAASERDRDRPAASERDRDRPAASERDRDRPAASERDRDRPAASERDRDRPAASERDRDRPAASERDRDRLAASERDRDRPAASERDRPIDRDRPVSNMRDRPIDRDRPAPREALTERERLTERDRPGERSRVAEPRRERDVGPRSYAEAPAQEPAAAPRRDYDDRRNR